jgi:hypothetical protein
MELDLIEYHDRLLSLSLEYEEVSKDHTKVLDLQDIADNITKLQLKVSKYFSYLNKVYTENKLKYENGYNYHLEKIKQKYKEEGKRITVAELESKTKQMVSVYKEKYFTSENEMKVALRFIAQAKAYLDRIIQRVSLYKKNIY